MADGCDDPSRSTSSPGSSNGAWSSRRRPAIPGEASRSGGPLLKGLMSRMAGASLQVLARVGTWDADQFLQGVLDRTFVTRWASTATRASKSGSSWWPRPGDSACPVAEMPTIWLDRTFGVSNFKIGKVAARSTCGGTALPSARSFDRRDRRSLLQDDGHEPRRSNRHKEGDDGESGERLGGFHRRLRGRRAAPRGYDVVGIDNFSKYGPVRSHTTTIPSTRSSRATAETST